MDCFPDLVKERDDLQHVAVITEERFSSLEQLDIKICKILEDIKNCQLADIQSNETTRTLLKESAKLHKESANNLLLATDSIRIVTDLQVKQQEWYQGEIEKNSSFWRKVVWRSLLVGATIILAAFGINKFIEIL